MNLPSDYARCHGDGSETCSRCERRLQIERDEQARPQRWFPFLHGAPTNGTCVFRILDLTGLQ